MQRRKFSVIIFETKQKSDHQDESRLVLIELHPF